MEVNTEHTSQMSKQIGTQENRMLKAQHEKKRSVWTGLGLFGMVGWTIVAPTLIGAGIGRWLDTKYMQSFSWTLSLLIVGLTLGCYAAWHWIKKEYNNMHKNNSNENN